MAPNEKVLKSALLSAVKDAWGDDRESITVKFIRSKVEKTFDLDEGFFKRDENWNSKSKALINDEFQRLEAIEASGEAPSSPPKAKAKATITKKPVAKRASTSESKTPARKRQKKADTPSDIESELSDAPDDTVEEDTPDDSESSSLSDLSEKEEESRVKAKKSATKPIPKPRTKAKPESADEDEDIDEPEVSRDTADGSDSEMSVLIDEEPKAKKSKSTSSSGVKASTKTAKAKPPPNITPEEAEMKTLQSQLKKCGINKIWGFELKQFEDDTKAKIRHLKSMLRDVGMDGRFSEARAKEIKERRELMADVEAISAVAATVGAPRQRRSKAKAEQALKEASDEEDASDLEEPPAKQRIAAAKQDLAFLGSESESD